MKHFDYIAAIPGPSIKEAAIRQYVLDEATRLGLRVTQDAAGNVVVSKPVDPGRGSATSALLQGYLGMVCEKNEGTPLISKDVDFHCSGVQVRPGQSDHFRSAKTSATGKHYHCPVTHRELFGKKLELFRGENVLVAETLR